MKNLIFFLKNYIFRHSTIDIAKKSIHLKKLDHDSKKQFSNRKMFDIFDYAKKNSSFYAKKYMRVEINQNFTTNDWENIPILEKNEIRENQESMICAKKRNLKKITTGGSTGAPLVVYHDKRFCDEVIGWEILKSWGLSPSCNKAFIFRITRKSLIKKILNFIIWYPTRRCFLNAAEITDSSMAEFACQLNTLKPPLLQGYIGGIMEFAKYCERQNLIFDFIKVIWSTSSPLSKSNKKYLESTLKAKVYDQYGTSEIFWIAAECKNQIGLHVHDEYRFVEIVDDKGKNVDTGVYGDIVVTDLYNYAFPLIRYRIGDRGRYLDYKCDCGIDSPILDTIKGRTTDNLKLPSGRTVSGEFLTTIFDDKPDAVKGFQIYQHSNYNIDLNCILGNGEKSKEICNQKKIYIEGLLDHEVSVNIKYLQKIDHYAGKTKYIISDIKERTL
ncbi:MAG: phenylacetate--CoA ligase family protein [Bacteroidales bacterium]